MSKPPRAAHSNRFFAFVVPGVSLACAAGLLFLYSSDDTKDTALIGVASAQHATGIPGYIANRDTNTNGLSDWEELLAGMAREYGSGRTARTGGEGDVLSPDTLFTNDPSLSVTERAAREMFGTYLTLRREGELGENEKLELLKKVTAQAQAMVPVSRVSPNELTIDTDSSPDGFRRYQTELFRALEPSLALRENEVLLFARMYEEGDPRARDELLRVVGIYRDLALHLRDMQVPGSIAGLHAELIMALEDATYDLDMLANIERDPLGALVVVGRFGDSARRVSQAISGVLTTVAAGIAS